MDTTSAVGDAINSLIGRDAQAIWVGGDNTVIAGDQHGDRHRAARQRVPVFTDPARRARSRHALRRRPGLLRRSGAQGGALAADMLEGADMTKIPVRDVLDLVPPYLSVNTNALKGLKEPWRVPDEAAGRGHVVVDDDGRAPQGGAPRPPASRPPSQAAVEEVAPQPGPAQSRARRRGGGAGRARRAARRRGSSRAATTRRRSANAQGDMATVSGLVDAAVGDDADLLITFSTPTLQAALQRAKRLPVVFNYVADPIAAGAGTSDTAHAAERHRRLPASAPTIR